MIDNKVTELVGREVRGFKILRVISNDGTLYEVRCLKCGRLSYPKPSTFSRYKSTHCAICNNALKFRPTKPDSVVMDEIKQWRRIWR